MTDKRTQEQADQSNMEKDPRDWVTGDEPMTGAQRSYLKTLSEEAKQPFDDSLSKAGASRRIDELQRITGRGQPDAGRGSAGEPGAGHAERRPAPDDAVAGSSAGASGEVLRDAEVDARFEPGADGGGARSPTAAGKR